MARKPTDFEIGEWVTYGPTGEKGRVKSMNDTYVFVVFKCSDGWDNYQDNTGCACKPYYLWTQDQLNPQNISRDDPRLRDV